MAAAAAIEGHFVDIRELGPLSSAPPGASWRHAELATSFLERREAFVPMLDVQEDIVRRLLAAPRASDLALPGPRLR